MIINISVAMADPTNATPPSGFYYDILIDNIPDGYGLDKIGLPPPLWYLSPVPISFDGIDPLNPFNFPEYVPDPPDPSKPDISPTFYYVGLASSTIIGQPGSPGVTIPGSGIPGAVGAPAPVVGADGLLGIINGIVPPVNPIIAGLNNQLNAIGGGPGPDGGPNVPGIIPPIVGNIQGQLDAAFENAAVLPGKIPGKIGDQLVSTMGDVYGTGIGLGIDVPTVDDIIGGNVGFQYAPMIPDNFGGFTTIPTGDPIAGFGIVGGGGFGGLGGGVMIPPGQPVQGGGGVGAGGQANIAPIPFGFQPVPDDPVAPRVQNVGGVVGPAQAGKPIAGGAFAPVAPVAPLPPNFPIPGGGGGGVVGVPVVGGGDGGGNNSQGSYPPDYYPPGYYPPGYYPPGYVPPFTPPEMLPPPIAPMQVIQGGGFTTIPAPPGQAPVIVNVAPPGVPVNVNVAGGSTTSISNISTSNVSTTTTNNNEAPSPSPSPTPTPDEEEEIPKPAPLELNPINLAAGGGNWEFGEACGTPPMAVNFNSDELFGVFGFKRKNKDELTPPKWLDPSTYPFGSQWIASIGMNVVGNFIKAANNLFIASIPIVNNWQDFQVLAIGGIVEKYLGFPVLPFLQGNIYNINYNNPQILPGIPDLQNLFRKGVISEQIFRCLVRANGSYDSWQMKIAESSTLIPSLFDVIKLKRGKRLTDDQFGYYANLNGLKVGTNQGKVDLDTFLKATEAIPGVADLVRMMVRDAADDTVAGKYETDKFFKDKFTGQVEEWSEQQGVDKDIMKYFWRAHWEIPSNTQLFDMLHKLRPNRKVGAVPGNIATTAADVKQAIQVNDLMPFWVDRVMATSYHPLTRVDAQRAFFIDAISEDRLYDAYMDLGYNAENAQALVDFSKELKKKRENNLPGADKATTILSQLKRYLISRDDAYNRLVAIGMKKDKANSAVSNTILDRMYEARGKCIKEAQKRFFRAEYDLLTYKSKIMGLGVPGANVESLVTETACLYDSRGKELNASALCKAFKQNIIAFDQFQNRLKLIGYDTDEAYIIAESCQIDKVAAIGKVKLQKEAKEKAAADKAKKEAEKKLKEAKKKPAQAMTTQEVK